MAKIIQVAPSIKHASIEAVIIRADGTREDLGVISEYDSNPLKQAWINIRRFVRCRLWRSL